MTSWTISYNGKSCQPVLVKAQEQQNTPTLWLTFEEKSFTVEFKNQSDYFASRDGSLAYVVIVSANRSRRVAGTAINQKI